MNNIRDGPALHPKLGVCNDNSDIDRPSFYRDKPEIRLICRMLSTTHKNKEFIVIIMHNTTIFCAVALRKGNIYKKMYCQVQKDVINKVQLSTE